MCLNPKWIYKKGHYKETNYRGQEGEFYEIGTYSKCGCCEVCLAERANNWVVRNVYEAKRHKKISFITLTYAESPIILVRKDLQNFMKRLRRYLDYNGYEKVRMFGAGEYGSRNNRPHFHLILYGFADENAQYLDINKKNNILYKSEIIEKIWKKGRTSYQEFEEHEIPYIALYENPKEQYKRAYKITMQTAKNLREYAKRWIRMSEEERKNLLEEIKNIEKTLKKTKEKYYMVKEFNTWSIALGWEQFYDEYAKAKEYTFIEYIEDKEFYTPTPWVKKLANMGDIPARNEMFRREEEIVQSMNETEEMKKNKLKVMKRKKKELRDWIDKKDKVETL